jgi:hypothetical protein
LRARLHMLGRNSTRRAAHTSSDFAQLWPDRR